MQTYTPAIVTLMIGTNDINGNIDVSTAPDRLGALLDSIYAANPNVLIVLAPIVPTGSDSTNQAVQKYIPHGAHMGDNLHPNQAGYDLLGATWYAAVAPFLP